MAGQDFSGGERELVKLLPKDLVVVRAEAETMLKRKGTNMPPFVVGKRFEAYKI